MAVYILMEAECATPLRGKAENSHSFLCRFP